jgi:hypothetical protein
LDLSLPDEWHQYDGFLSLKPSGNIFQRGYTYIFGQTEKNNQLYASTFAQHFCPTWFKSEFNLTKTTCLPAESVQELICLYNGLRKVYYVDNRLFFNEEEYGRNVRV